MLVGHHPNLKTLALQKTVRKMEKNSHRKYFQIIYLIGDLYPDELSQLNNKKTTQCKNWQMV